MIFHIKYIYCSFILFFPYKLSEIFKNVSSLFFRIKTLKFIERPKKKEMTYISSIFLD